MLSSTIRGPCRCWRFCWPGSGPLPLCFGAVLMAPAVTGGVGGARPPPAAGAPLPAVRGDSADLGLRSTVSPSNPGAKGSQPAVAQVRGELGGGLGAVRLLKASEEGVAEAILLSSD